MRITQEKAVFYILWKSYKANPLEFVPAWKFVGEVCIEEMGDKWFFMSYKCPANGVNIFFSNPGLIERRMTTGKTGAKYFEYKIAPNPSREKITDPILLKFYDELKQK
jgi:hypothetical protein